MGGDLLRQQLHQAVRTRDADAVTRVLRYKPSINSASGSEQNTALHWAVQGGSDEIVVLLLKNGANPSLTNAKGESPLDIAKHHQNQTLVRILQAEITRHEKNKWQSKTNLFGGDDLFEGIVFDDGFNMLDEDLVRFDGSSDNEGEGTLKKDFEDESDSSSSAEFDISTSDLDSLLDESPR